MEYKSGDFFEYIWNYEEKGKNMKRITLLLICLVLFVFTVSCSEAGSAAKFLSVDGNIKALIIDVASGKVNVYYHNKPTAEIFASEEFDFSNIGGTLKIKFPKKKLCIFDFGKKEISVYLPQDILLEYVDIEVASATVNVDNLKAGKIEIESASGTVHANNIEADSVSFDTASGSVHVGGNIKAELEIETASGSIHVNAAKLPRETEIDSSSGSVNLKVPENSGITLRLNTSSGKFKTNLPFVQSVHSKQYVLGDGSSSVVIETSSGSINIEKI